MQFLLHVAMYYRLNFSFRAFDANTVWTFYSVVKKFIPCVFAMSIMEINLFITTSLATYLPAGTISLLRYANRFMGIPYGVFAIALSTILLPYFSRIGVYAPKRLSIYFYEAAKLVFYITVPAALVMSVLSHTLFKTLFFSKKFTLMQVELASTYLIIFLIGLFFFSINKILLNLFYALHDSVSPTLVATVAIGVHYCSSIMLLRYYGGAGLAGAFVISAMAQTLLYIFLLHKKFNIRFFLKQFCFFVGKAAFQSTVILLFFYAVYRALRLGIGVYCPLWASHALLDSIVCWLWIVPLIVLLIRVYAQTRQMFGIKLYFLDQ